MNRFKELRSAAVSTLKGIATQLVKRGEFYGTAESRKELIAERAPILDQQVDFISILLHFSIYTGLDRRRFCGYTSQKNQRCS